MPRIYPEGGTANIGDKRWEVEWWVMNKGVAKKLKDGGEFDPDNDQYAEVKFFPHDQHEQAQAFAQQVCNEWDKRGLTFAVVTVQEQVCDWFERKHNLAEWQNIGEQEWLDEPIEREVAA